MRVTSKRQLYLKQQKDRGVGKNANDAKGGGTAEYTSEEAPDHTSAVLTLTQTSNPF